MRPRWLEKARLHLWVGSCVLAMIGRAGEWVLYVATNGCDEWSGHLATPQPDRGDGPLASLHVALERVAQQARSGPGTIRVGPGVWVVSEPIRLGPRHSGKPDCPLLIQGDPSGRTVLRGSRPVTNWSRGPGSVWVADLRGSGLQTRRFRQVFYRGQRMVLARWPNFDPENPYAGGWAYVDGTPIPMYQDVPGERRDEFQYRPSDAPHWQDWAGAEVVVFPRYNWWNNILPVVAVERERRRVKLGQPASYPIRPGDRYYVRGVQSALDAAGEWWLDSARHQLWFIPPEGGVTEPVWVPVTTAIVQFDPGAAWIHLERFVLEFSEGHGVVLDRATNCQVAACTIRCVGDYRHHGVAILNGLSNTVVGCDIYDIGASGVSLNGGDFIHLRPGGHTVENCYIHHVGRFYAQGVGIAMSGVGHRAAHNLIHDGPRMGIQFHGQNIVIEFNHIRHMNLETSDTGGTYTGGRDWIGSRGSVIRYNFIHDMVGFHKEGDRWVMPSFAWGIYQDDNAGGVDIIGNVVARCPRAALHLHNGRDTRILNNIFVDCGQQMIEYSGWTATHRYWTNHLPTMSRHYEMVVTSPVWRTMRNMHIHPTNAVQPDGTIMTGNEFYRNIVVWRGTNTALFRFRNLPLHAYASDSNLVWGFGQPIRTGFLRGGRELSGNLLPHGSFESSTASNRVVGWRFQTHVIGARMSLAESGEDGRALLIESGHGTNPAGKAESAVIVSDDLELKPGALYRLRFRTRSLDGPVALAAMLQSYKANVYYWAGGEREWRVQRTWTNLEQFIAVPAPGEARYRPDMTAFRVRLDVRTPGTRVALSDITLVECERLDEWESWRALGFDRHSYVADPKFRDLERDDFRLSSDSPARKIGFEPIPVDRIGPYQHPLRATWPIREAPGAREFLQKAGIRLP